MGYRMTYDINNSSKQPVVLNALENHGSFVTAISTQDVKEAKKLISQMLHPDMRDEYDRTPLMYAVLKDCDDIMYYLFKKNADPSLRDREGYTALHRAAQMGSAKNVEAIIKHALVMGLELHNFIEIKSCRGLTALCSGAMLGYEEVVSTLLSYGANPAVRNYDGYSVLMTLAIKGHAHVIEQLLSYQSEDSTKKVDVNEVNARGWSPLHFAAYHNQKAAAEALLRFHANINMTDHTERTPLMMTAKCDMALFLISHGAYINKTTKEGESALTRALRNHQEKLLKLLISKHANLLDDKVQTVCARELPVSLHELYIQERDEQRIAFQLLTMSHANDIKTAYEEAKVQDNFYLIEAIDHWFIRQNVSLLKACKHRDLFVMKDILDKGVDPLHCMFMRFNSVMYAAFTNRRQVVDLLLNYVDRERMSAVSMMMLSLLGYAHELSKSPVLVECPVRSSELPISQSVLAIDDDVLYPEMNLGEEDVFGHDLSQK